MNPQDLIKLALEKIKNANISPNPRLTLTPEMVRQQFVTGLDKAATQQELASHATYKKLSNISLSPEEDTAFHNQLASTPVTAMEGVGAKAIPSILKNILREGQPAIGENYSGFDDLVARERFNLPELQKIGAGSDRDVYDLGDKVLKIAKQARGLAQNYSEGDMYAPVPEVFERGKNYVVAEKVGKPDAKTKQLVQEINDSLLTVRNPHAHIADVLNPIIEKYSNAGDDDVANVVSDLMNYDPMRGDLARVKNWGTKDGVPVLLDGGALSERTLKDFHGTTNMSDPDFRSAVMQSRAAKKKFGDTDKAKMYGVVASALASLLASEQDHQKDSATMKLATKKL